MSHNKMNVILAIVIVINIVVLGLVVKLAIEFKNELYNKFNTVDSSIYDINQRLNQWEFISEEAE